MFPIYSLDTYLRLLNGFYPRLLAQIDRDPHSPTYGSCDRGFWMYRLHDFDSGVLQQSGLTFACLNALADDVDLSPYPHLDPKNKNLWAQLGLAINRRTIKLLARHGLLDEYYPGERSFPGTVFTSYAVLKSALMLGQQEIVQSEGLRKTAGQFLKRRASPAANQDLAAAAFLALYKQTHDWQSAQTEKVLDGLIKRPAQSGNFLEYGGADLGYASVTLNYLAYLHADGSYAVRAQLQALAKFIAAFVTLAGRLGGEFASRSTTYFLPYGVLEAAYADPNLASSFSPLDLDTAFNSLDDRYLLHYCLPSLAMAALRLARSGPPELAPSNPPSDWQIQSFPEFHLHACRRQEAAFFVGLNKGGAFQLEWQGQTEIDCGYRLSRDGRTFASCVLQDQPQYTFTQTDERLSIELTAPFSRYAALTASSLKTIALRVLSLLGTALNALFKRLLIQQPRQLPGVMLHRRIDLDLSQNLITVQDEISGMQNGDRLTRSPAASFRLVPSAKFHQPGEEAAFLKASPPLEGNTFTYVYVLGPQETAPGTLAAERSAKRASSNP